MKTAYVKTANGERLTRGKDRFDFFDGTPKKARLDAFVRRLVAEGSLVICENIDIQEDDQTPVNPKIEP